MSLESALAQFSSQPLLKASRALFKDTLEIPLSPLADAAIEPKRFFRDAFDEKRHSGIDRLFLVGRVDDRCFQAAHGHVSATALDLDAAVKETEKDYQGMFLVAVEMNAAEFTRSDLAARTREINRIFTNPVIVIFKHQLQKETVISIGVANRREHKRDKGKDVLGKVSMIREIRPQSPHRGHIEILKDFSLAELEKNSGKGKRGHKIDSFKSFHAALEAVFNTDLLNARFYKELANWYFWALPQVQFPADLEADDEKRRATGLIRLLTRLIFCWFLKEKNLIPEKLFHPTDLAKMLKGFDPESETGSTYYQAILQNLFFATLNQRMGKDGNGKPYRLFATDEGFAKNRATYDVNNLYRYEKLFAGSQDDALAHFADIPFLNGGLFECLDRTEDGTDKKRYLDGFSRNAKKRPHIPDELFFGREREVDLSGPFNDKKRKKEKVTGLITILNRYKFTIVENTPIDQEIALDPELLGKVFENLLASYNEETKTTARKQTGSFYTPRPIVDYMVDESLKAHLTRKLEEAHAKPRSREEERDLEKGSASDPLRASASPTEIPSSETLRAFASSRETRLSQLFAYTEEPHAFTPSEVATLIASIDALKILDPACGSGAFPMGVLHKLVYILQKLDRDNDRWKQTQLAKLDSAPMREELERAFADNNDDYGRKLYLIENCLYGVDIQPIAIQITKLRFFISLVCDQKTNRNKKDNHGIRPLPNLETKFVAANSLLGIPKKTVPEGHFDLTTDAIHYLQTQLQGVRHQYFTVQHRRQKLDLQKKDKELRQKLAHELARSYAEKRDADTVEKLAQWDPFDPQCSAAFFDAEWMFGAILAKGFDVVIGNPPWISNDSIPDIVKGQLQSIYSYSTQSRFDISCPFVELSLNTLMADRAVGALVLPEHLWLGEYFVAFRQHTYKHWREVTSLKEGYFEAVNNPASLLVFSKDVSQDFVVGKSLLDKEIVRHRQTKDFVEAEVQLGSRGQKIHTFKVFFDLDYRLLKAHFATQSNCVFLDEICIVTDGVQTANVLNEIMTDKVPKDQSHYHKALRKGKSIPCRYGHLVWDGWWLLKPEFASNFKRPGFSYDSPKRMLCFDSEEKIVIRQTEPTIVATIDAQGFFFPNSIFQCIVKEEFRDEVSLYFVLGILNSNLIRRFYLLASQVEGTTKPQLYINILKSLPFCKMKLPEQQSIISCVQNILAAKKQNPAADTSALEREIDQQVYALYGLTPDEIAIVEGTAK